MSLSTLFRKRGLKSRSHSPIPPANTSSNSPNPASSPQPVIAAGQLTQPVPSSIAVGAPPPGQDSDIPFGLEIKVLKAVGLVEDQKHYVKIELGSKVVKSKRSKTGEWNETFSDFIATASSEITFEIYEAHSSPFIRSKLEGSIRVDVKSVLGDGTPSLVPITQTISLEVAIRSVQPIDNLVNATVSSLGRRTQDVIHFINSLSTLGLPLGELSTPSKIVVGVLNNVVKLIDNQMKMDKQVEDLLDTMLKAHEFVGDVHKARESIKEETKRGETLVSLIQLTLECSYFIRDYIEKNFAQRLMQSFVQNVQVTIDNFVGKFNKFHDAWVKGSLFDIQTKTVRILGVVEKIAEQSFLNDLPYTGGARYSVGSCCLENTRTNIINEIDGWINTSGTSVPRLCVLLGGAGKGKSAIANSIARRYDKEIGRLGSSFRFQRGLDRKHLFSTMSRNIADYDPAFRSALIATVEGNTSLRKSEEYLDQFNIMVESFESLTIVGPLVIVIDALDECAEKEINGLIEVLSGHIDKFPDNLRIFLTARPILNIESALKTTNAKVLNLDNVDTISTTADISLYVNSCLQNMTGLGDIPAAVKQITSHSQNLFLFAAIVCNALKKTNAQLPSEYLKILLVGHGLHDLYRSVLESLFDFKNSNEVSNFKHVVGFLLAATQPLSLDSLQKLSCHDSKLNALITHILPQLGALFSGTSDHTSPILPIHTTFRDFLTEKSEWPEFLIDKLSASAAQEAIALGALAYMDQRLHFNMCSIPTSGLRNQDQPAIVKENIDNFFDIALQFAISDWSDLISRCKDSMELRKAALTFLHQNLLFWLEALSLLRLMKISTDALQMLVIWADTGEISEFALDAIQFISSFGRIISEAAPHIYLSALGFAPHQSLVRLYFIQLYNGLNTMQHSQSQWQGLPKILGIHASSVLCALFSPDGKKVVSCSWSNVHQQTLSHTKTTTERFIDDCSSVVL